MTDDRLPTTDDLLSHLVLPTDSYSVVQGRSAKCHDAEQQDGGGQESSRPRLLLVVFDLGRRLDRRPIVGREYMERAFLDRETGRGRDHEEDGREQKQ